MFNLVLSPIKGSEFKGISSLKPNSLFILFVSLTSNNHKVSYSLLVGWIIFASIFSKVLTSIGINGETFTNSAPASKITHIFGFVKLLVNPAAWQFGIHVFSLKLKYSDPVHDVQLL